VHCTRCHGSVRLPRAAHRAGHARFWYGPRATRAQSVRSAATDTLDLFAGTRLFSYFFLFSAALTVLTSNDIVILTLTPIIAALASYANIDPTPALFGQFFAANILSLELFIGNPTNIIVAEAYGLSFLGYSVWMASVGIFAGIICFALLMFVFRNEIPITFRVPVVSTAGVIKDKFGKSLVQ
jgi:Na+/H+ antiporter NhaD/arsenite permease-like protein